MDLRLPTGVAARAATRRLVPLLTALLAACAGAPYQPYAATDATRLRLRLVFPDAYRAWTSPYRVQASVSVQTLRHAESASQLCAPRS